MSGDIQLGEYIRTKEGYIAKCKKVDETKLKNEYCYWFDNYVDEDYENLFTDELEEFVSKHSFNIKDLIEEGDLVNGQIILAEDTLDDGSKVYTVDKFRGVERVIFARSMDIKSIVTKEQLENITYKVEG